MSKGIRVRSLKDLGKGKWKLTNDSVMELQRKPAINNLRLVRKGPTPHEKLWFAIEAKWPGLASLEYENAIPNRKYRLDIAFVEYLVAVECDGWEWHGKHKGDFERDRVRQNILTVHGWRILRFTAGQIHKDIQSCLEMITITLWPTIKEDSSAGKKE